MKSTGRLDREQRKYFDRLVKMLEPVMNLEERDVFMLENAAKCFAVMKEAETMMGKAGLIQEFQNGARQVSPEWAVWRNASRDFEMYVKHFGLSPKARADLNIEAKETRPADPVEGLRKVS